MSYKKKTAISKTVISVIVLLFVIFVVIGAVAYFTNGFSGENNNIPVVKEYTVTFVANGEIVDAQKYTEEDIKITVPDVPEKQGYTGEWEEYMLNNEDIIVNAVYSVITYKIEYIDPTYKSSQNNYYIFGSKSEYRKAGLSDGSYPTAYNVESGNVQISLLKSTFSCACNGQAGYRFNGWYLDSDCTIPFDGIIPEGSIGDFIIYADIEMTHTHNY